MLVRLFNLMTDESFELHEPEITDESNKNTWKQLVEWYTGMDDDKRMHQQYIRGKQVQSAQSGGANDDDERQFHMDVRSDAQKEIEDDGAMYYIAYFLHSYRRYIISRYDQFRKLLKEDTAGSVDASVSARRAELTEIEKELSDTIKRIEKLDLEIPRTERALERAYAKQKKAGKTQF